MENFIIYISKQPQVHYNQVSEGYLWFQTFTSSENTIHHVMNVYQIRIGGDMNANSDLINLMDYVIFNIHLSKIRHNNVNIKKNNITIENNNNKKL